MSAPPNYELTVLRPIIVQKGWGREEIHWNSAYCSKTMYIGHGLQSSWHVHNCKDEIFRVVKGRLAFWYGLDPDITLARLAILEPGDIVHIPPLLHHRFKSVEGECVFEEVST